MLPNYGCSATLGVLQNLPLPMVLPRERGLRRGVDRARPAVASCARTARRARESGAEFAAHKVRAPRRSNLAYNSSDSSPDGSFRARSAGGADGVC